MRDISMHILDIVMNSIHAKATFIEIKLNEQSERIDLMIKDNGIGMDELMLKNVMDPFFTTRTTRKVGLGLSLLKNNVEKTGGKINIVSKVGFGTILEATFKKNHLDCIPLGDIDETILSLILLEPNLNFRFIHKKFDQEYILDTLEVKSILKEVPINERTVLNWLKENLVHKFD